MKSMMENKEDIRNIIENFNRNKQGKIQNLTLLVGIVMQGPPTANSTSGLFMHSYIGTVLDWVRGTRRSVRELSSNWESSEPEGKILNILTDELDRIETICEEEFMNLRKEVRSQKVKT